MPRVTEQGIDTFGRILFAVVLCGLVLVSDGCASERVSRHYADPPCWEE